MIRGPALALALGLAAALPGPVRAQSANGGAGTVGSAVLHNGFPAGGGAVVLPSLSSPAAIAAPASSTGGSTGGGGSATGGGRSTAAGSPAAGPTGTRASTQRGSGGTFVLCPPSGASGEDAFLLGTDLACAPR